MQLDQHDEAATPAPAWTYDDGGRKAAGFRGRKDCVVRAIAIAFPLPYREARALVARYAAGEKRRKDGLGRRARAGRGSSPGGGVFDSTWRRILLANGWRYCPPTWDARLNPTDLPPGRLIVCLPRHLAAVIDGRVRDTYDSSKGGSALVGGYWTAPAVGGAN